MKIIQLIVLQATFIFIAEGINAQCINGTLSYPLYKDGAELVKQIDDKGDEIVHIEYDLLFTSRETFRTLTSDWTYTIMVFTDGGLKNLDMKIYEYNEMSSAWNIVAEDQVSDGNAVVTVTPSVTAQYKIELIANRFNDGYTVSRYGMIIYHK